MPDQTPFAEDFFVYEADFSALAAGTSDSGTINIDSDSNFVLQKLTYLADIAAAAQTASGRVIPLVTVLITSTGSGRQLSDEALPIVNIFGTGEIPFIMTQPKVFPSNATIKIAVSNFSAATTYNLKLSFIGKKMFYR